MGRQRAQQAAGWSLEELLKVFSGEKDEENADDDDEDEEDDDDDDDDD